MRRSNNSGAQNELANGNREGRPQRGRHQSEIDNSYGRDNEDTNNQRHQKVPQERPWAQLQFYRMVAALQKRNNKLRNLLRRETMTKY